MAKRKVQCPICTGDVLVKTGGKVFASADKFLARCGLKINLSGLLGIFGPKKQSKKSLQKGPCKACGGSGTIEDPSDDAARYAEMKSAAQQLAPKLLEEEAKLNGGKACGSRYSIIRGSDLLEVGLGFNDNSSYRIDEDADLRLKGMGNGKVPIPEGGKCNKVQGIPAPWPEETGNYMIKCSNKFQLLVGANGIDITTGGPLTIGAGITQIIGPEITIGSQSGRLTLEGQVVNLNGKSVEVAPTDGQFIVKGTIGNTGNIICGGHAHAESISFVKAQCPGVNKETKLGGPTDLTTLKAQWSGLSTNAITTLLGDIQGFVLSTLAEPTTKGQLLLSTRGITMLTDKISSLSYLTGSIELVPTGIAIGPIVYNFPHVHGLPDMAHSHDVRLPDIDFSTDSADALRGQVLTPALESGAPLYVSSTKALQKILAFVDSIQSIVTVLSQLASKLKLS